MGLPRRHRTEVLPEPPTAAKYSAPLHQPAPLHPFNTKGRRARRNERHRSSQQFFGCCSRCPSCPSCLRVESVGAGARGTPRCARCLGGEFLLPRDRRCRSTRGRRPKKGGWNGHEARSQRDRNGEGDVKGSTMSAEGRRLVRPQSRGLRACSDVSQNAALPCTHWLAR
jgi:hypothetical protein